MLQKSTCSPWFNPGFNYAFFLVLALSLAIWRQCCTIASSTGVIGEKEVPSWLHVKASGVSKWVFFASKACARIILFMAILLPVYFLAFSLLGQHPACSYLTIIMFSFFFTVALDGLGLIGAVYTSGVLQDIPIAVLDLDSSKLSREVITAFTERPKFKVAGNFDTYRQLEMSMENGTVRAGVIIPEGFEKDASLYRGAQVLVVYDASNLIWGYNTRKYAMEIISKFSVDRTSAFLGGLGMNEEAIRDTLDSVSCNFEIWYNPTLSYATFLFLSMVLMIIHQLGLLGPAISVTRDMDRNSWLQFLGAPVSRWKVYLGKSIPYFAVNIFNYALLLTLAKEIVGVKMRGQVSLIVFLGLIYILIITSIGFFISVHARDSMQVTRYVMLLSTPLFIISGISWPVTDMPLWVHWLSRITPFAWMAEGMRTVTLKNLGLGYIGIHVFALCLNFSKRKKLTNGGTT